MSDAPEDPPAPANEEHEQAPRRRRGARLLLALTSFVLTFLLLELATRIAVRPPAPVLIRDGIYASGLGKVNGFDTRTFYKGEPLAEKKRPGEIRIAVFGESTVQGSPWEAFGSPVTMLHDHLHQAMPEGDFTVLNMGRGSGFTIDAYYFLVTLKRFKPDFVLLYQGANDEYNTDYEMCLPSVHPHLHRAWRWLVEHSRLMWTVRAQGPLFFSRLKKKNSTGHAITNKPNNCDPVRGFKSWTDLLVETAQGMGAKVIVTTPVSNPLRWAELDGQFGIDKPIDLDKKDVHYRKMLACLLTPGCDIGDSWKQETSTGYLQSLFTCLTRPTCNGGRYPPIGWLLPRVRISIETAAERGARSIDFHTFIAREMGQGLKPLIFVDEMHLTLEGLWILSWKWTREIVNELNGTTLPDAPPPLDKDGYLTAVMKDLNRGPACIFLRTVPIFWRADMPLVGAVQLKMAVESEVKTPGTRARSRAGLTAQILSGWLRQHLGLDPGIPAELVPVIAQVDIQQIAKELSEQPNCSTVGGPSLEPFVADKVESRAKEPPKAGPEQPGPPQDAWFIPPGQEQAITDWIGSIEPDRCKLDEAAVQKNFIHLVYQCPHAAKNRTAVVDLRHPSEAHAAEKTSRVTLFGGDPAPSDKLLSDLAAALREKEKTLPKGAFPFNR